MRVTDNRGLWPAMLQFFYESVVAAVIYYASALNPAPVCPAHLPVIDRFRFRWIRAATKLCRMADFQDRIEQIWATVIFQLLVSKYFQMVSVGLCQSFSSSKTSLIEITLRTVHSKWIIYFTNKVSLEWGCAKTCWDCLGGWILPHAAMPCICCGCQWPKLSASQNAGVNSDLGSCDESWSMIHLPIESIEYQQICLNKHYTEI